MGIHLKAASGDQDDEKNISLENRKAVSSNFAKIKEKNTSSTYHDSFVGR